SLLYFSRDKACLVPTFTLSMKYNNISKEKGGLTLVSPDDFLGKSFPFAILKTTTFKKAANFF
ncbi:MAG: hypothetical protein KKH98_10245, partial [Spirochaetes bacterium]|nr:hypothetical protein [Spirochaetota bacterium]